MDCFVPRNDRDALRVIARRNDEAIQKSEIRNLKS